MHIIYTETCIFSIHSPFFTDDQVHLELLNWDRQTFQVWRRRGTRCEWSQRAGKRGTKAASWTAGRSTRRSSTTIPPWSWPSTELFEPGRVRIGMLVIQTWKIRSRLYRKRVLQLDSLFSRSKWLTRFGTDLYSNLAFCCFRIIAQIDSVNFLD